MKNITTTTKFDCECVFSSDIHLIGSNRLQPLSRSNIFQDQRCQNHSAKNLEMCKNWFYTSLLKITRFTTISKSKCFRIILDCESSARSIPLGAAKDEIHGEMFAILNTEWRRKIVFFQVCHRWASGTTVVVMSETANICFLSALAGVSISTDDWQNASAYCVWVLEYF